MMEENQITRAHAREALARVEEVVKTALIALESAPYGTSLRAVKALDTLPESVACELGLEVIGNCECGTMIFDGDDYIQTRDGCNLCAECRPSDEEMAKIAAIQAACPKGDPECEAQTSDDDHGRCWGPEDRNETVSASASPEEAS